MAFSHAGNGAVIAKLVMHPLGLSQGMPDNGLPSLIPKYCQFGNDMSIMVHANHWPLGKDHRFPAISSKALQLFQYGIQHYCVSLPPSLPISPPSLMLLLEVYTCKHV